MQFRLLPTVGQRLQKPVFTWSNAGQTQLLSEQSARDRAPGPAPWLQTEQSGLPLPPPCSKQHIHKPGMGCGGQLFNKYQ